MKYEYFHRSTERCVCVLNSRGWKRYEWFRTLRMMRISALHIADDTGSWYHDCIDTVRPLLDKYKPVLLVGNSMGGYASLLFGALHGIKARAFAPQTTLLADWDHRWAAEWERIRRDTKHQPLLDLAGLDVDADIYYCVGVQEDRLHAERMGCDLKPRGCSAHDGAFKDLDMQQIFEIGEPPKVRAAS